jgi:5-methylcytosine-specific restriction protein B
VEALGKALSARTEDAFDREWPAAEAELAPVFSEPIWGLSGRAELYTEPNVGNLWKNELSEPVRTALEAAGVDRDGFHAWLGEVHFVYVSAYLESLFDKYQENRGWRVLAISIPALGVAAVGIASHYQHAQKHNRLGDVSNLLFDHAAAALAKQEIELPGRKVEAADWDGTGLMLSAVDEIAGVELPSGQVARLKYARTTTVKKILSSFICIRPLALSSPDLDRELEETMVALESVGRVLA